MTICLPLEEYTDTVNGIISFDTTATKYTTARESIMVEANNYRSQWEQLRILSVPETISSAHSAFVDAFNEQYESNLDTTQNTPEGLAATQENINEFAHYRADVGYARDHQPKASCELKTILSQSNLTLQVPGVCDATNIPKAPD